MTYILYIWLENKNIITSILKNEKLDNIPIYVY